MKLSKTAPIGLILASVAALTADLQAQQNVLPPILIGNISIGLQTVATGLAAPDYAISAPGDASRLFVVEQRGQVLVVQNGSLLPTPALDISSVISLGATAGVNSFNPANANDERGMLGLAFHPGFSTPSSPGY